MRRRWLVLAVLVLAGLAIGLGLAVTTSPTVHRLVYVAARARLVHLRTGLEDEGDRAVVFQSDGLRIAGSLYWPSGRPDGSAVILVHGNSPSGRRLGLYPLLARAVATRGYPVLTIDLRGFGESDEPGTAAPDDWDARRDISAAVTYLGSLPGIDITRVYVVGHSMGGAYAVAAAATDDRIAGIAALSPPRRVDERILAPGAPDRDFFYRRFARVRAARGHPEGHVPIGLFLHIARVWRLENYAGHFAAPGHQPILLVDGGREAPEDRAFLRRLYRAMSPPKRYVTLSGSNHHANSTQVGRLVVYDARALAALADTIDAWLGQVDDPTRPLAGAAARAMP